MTTVILATCSYSILTLVINIYDDGYISNSLVQYILFNSNKSILFDKITLFVDDVVALKMFIPNQQYKFEHRVKYSKITSEVNSNIV